jgi:ribonuclease III
MHQVLTKVQANIHYQFQNLDLLKQSLTHKSYLHQKDRDQSIVSHNERLEFLGDAVLELVITDYLYTSFDQDEGYLTALRAALVNYRCMGQVGTEIDLHKHILLSKGEREELGFARLSIVADCLEAVIGAIYLDGGYVPAKEFIMEFIVPKLEEIIDKKTYRDSKTDLQELVQEKYKITPRYKVLKSIGKDHEKIFVSGVYIGQDLITEGRGASKQEAETNAAKLAIEIITIKS